MNSITRHFFEPRRSLASRDLLQKDARRPSSFDRRAARIVRDTVPLFAGDLLSLGDERKIHVNNNRSKFNQNDSAG
jgi:hypothetical protein